MQRKYCRDCPEAKGNTYQGFREWLRKTFIGENPTAEEVATIVTEMDDALCPLPQRGPDETGELFTPENSSPENN